MSDTVDLATRQAQALAERLAQPMPPDAAADGWREETWAKWARIFESMAEAIAEVEVVASASISRAMDFDGVYQGEILEAAARLSRHIHAMSAAENR
jgi:hypothetical protein